jgi:5-hydroxyisourate hydrolase-like protein (transthyretin family)
MKQRLISGVVTVMILLVLQLQVSATGDLNNPRSGILKGRVVDATSNKPMEYVNVAVFRVADSSLITGTITNPDGIFKIESIALANTTSGFHSLDLKISSLLRSISVTTRVLIWAT